MYVGEGEKNVKKLFEEIRSLTTGEVQILFFDEIDSLLRRRSLEDSDTALRLKNLFMLELDNLLKDDSIRCIFIFASNFVQDLDSAFLRRLTKVYSVDKPNSIKEYELHVNNLLRKVNVHNNDKIGLVNLAYDNKISQADIKKIVSIAITDKIYNSLKSDSGLYVSGLRTNCYNKINLLGEKILSENCYSLGSEKDYSEIQTNEKHIGILAPELTILDFKNAITKIYNTNL